MKLKASIHAAKAASRHFAGITTNGSKKQVSKENPTINASIKCGIICIFSSDYSILKVLMYKKYITKYFKLQASPP